MKISADFDSKMFSPFVKYAARKIKHIILKKAKKIEIQTNRRTNRKKFIVIHVRGSDRKCAIDELTRHQLINKIESFGVSRNNSIVYLMTDLARNKRKIKAIRKHFRGSIFLESDIDLFQREEFRILGTYLVYATELELQAISDGIIRTYKGHGLPNKDKQLGFLVPPECQTKKSNLRI